MACLVDVRGGFDFVGMTLSYDLSVTVYDRAFAKALLAVKHVDVSVDSPPVILLLLSEELDALVDLNVLLATNVRGLELVIRH
jgi:hypothetical protein